MTLCDFVFGIDYHNFMRKFKNAYSTKRPQTETKTLFLQKKRENKICHSSKTTYKTSEENTGRHATIKTVLDMLMLHWTLNWQRLDKTRRRRNSCSKWNQVWPEWAWQEIKHVSGTEKLRCTNVDGHGRLTKVILTLQVLRISFKILPGSSFFVWSFTS